MSILKQTEPDKLISRLRGEIGEVIQSWVVLNIYDFKASELRSGDLVKDMANENLQLLNIVRSKFRDDIISRLSELSSTKHGRLNFNFAADKLKVQKKEVQEFAVFLKEQNLIFSRNKNIAHKQISPKWSQMDPSPAIPKKVLTRSVAWAILIMKNFDKEHLGEVYKRIWTIERKRRYKLQTPASANYMLLPYVRNEK